MIDFNRLAFTLKQQQNKRIQELQEKIKELEEEIRIITEFTDRIDDL